MAPDNNSSAHHHVYEFCTPYYPGSTLPAWESEPTFWPSTPRHRRAHASRYRSSWEAPPSSARSSQGHGFTWPPTKPAKRAANPANGVRSRAVERTPSLSCPLLLAFLTRLVSHRWDRRIPNPPGRGPCPRRGLWHWHWYDAHERALHEHRRAPRAICGRRTASRRERCDDAPCSATRSGRRPGIY